MKPEEMIEYHCAVCEKIYQTRYGISNHMNSQKHFEGYSEEFSDVKAERELKRIDKNLKKEIEIITRKK